MTIQIRFLHARESVLLRVVGVLDGSGAWRLLRLCTRLSVRRLVFIDLDGVERLMSFGAAVLGARLPSLGDRVQVRADHIRPEHVRLLSEAGVLPRALQA